MPMPGQFTVITAQSRESPDEDTGISLQNCSILATDDLYSNSSTVKSYLGRPWKVFSRTVILESYIEDFIDPTGWTAWSSDNEGLDTLYYGEYQNTGAGAATSRRVNWKGFKVITSASEAQGFTPANFIAGANWLRATTFPFSLGL